MFFGNCVAFCYAKRPIAILASQKVLHFAEHFALQNVQQNVKTPNDLFIYKKERSTSFIAKNLDSCCLQKKKLKKQYKTILHK